MLSNYGMSLNPFTCQIVTVTKDVDGLERVTIKELKGYHSVVKRDAEMVKSTLMANSYSEIVLLSSCS